MRIIDLIIHGTSGEPLVPDRELPGSGEPVTGAADLSGTAHADQVAKDGALGCTGCQDLGYCRRGLGAEELGAGCRAGSRLG